MDALTKSSDRPSHCVPQHVPPHLVVDVDVYDLPGGDVDPQTAWRAFQHDSPLVFSPYNGGHWVATHGEDIIKMYQDPTRFSSALIAIPDPGADRMLPIQTDPPVHAKYRANIQDFFTPSALKEMEPGVRELMVDLIEALRPHGECEFVSALALQLPLIVFLRMMGLPLEDRLFLRQKVEDFIASADLDVKRQAHGDLHRYLEGWINRRIAEPGDDGVTKITRATIDGRQFTREEMLSTLTLLLHAGLDTVANMLAFIALHLARYPGDRAYIRSHPERQHDVIQELLRRFAGPNLGRVLAQDYCYKGVELKAGDRIIFPHSLFNMDQSLVSNPDVVDFERKEPARHITFGTGPHTCAGALLARREIAIFLEEWLKRIPEFELDPERPPKLRTNQQNCVDELWLRWCSS